MENNGMVLKLMRVREGAVLPKQATAGSAGYDLCACIDAPQTIQPGARAVFPSGLAAEIPAGTAGFIFTRSGLGIKKGIHVTSASRCGQRLPRRDLRRPAQPERGAVYGAAGRAHRADDHHAVLCARDRRGRVAFRDGPRCGRLWQHRKIKGSRYGRRGAPHILGFFEKLQFVNLFG